MEQSLEFPRQPHEYDQSFGHALGEGWLGNANIHDLTGQRSYIMRVGVSYDHSEVEPMDFSGFSITSNNTMELDGMITGANNPSESFHCNKSFFFFFFFFFKFFIVFFFMEFRSLLSPTGFSSP